MYDLYCGPLFRQNLCLLKFPFDINMIFGKVQITLRDASVCCRGLFVSRIEAVHSNVLGLFCLLYIWCIVFSRFDQFVLIWFMFITSPELFVLAWTILYKV